MTWLSCCLALAGAQTDAPVQPEAPPAVLVLRLAVSKASAKREREYVEALGLQLDGFVVMAAEPEDKGSFAGAPLDEQVEQAKPLSEYYGAVATTWLVPRTGAAYLVVLSAHRIDTTVTQTVGRMRRATPASHLALVTRELLGEAYRPHPGAIREPALKRVVEETAPDEPPPPPPPSPPMSPWGVSAHGVSAYGVGDGLGPSLKAGLGASISYDVGPTRLQVTADLMAGPWKSATRMDLFGWQVELLGEIGLPFPAGAVELVPGMAVGLAMSHYSTQLDNGPTEGNTTFRPSIGVTLALVAPDLGGLFAELVGLYHLNDDAMLRSSDTRVVWESRPVDVGLRLGVRF